MRSRGWWDEREYGYGSLKQMSSQPQELDDDLLQVQRLDKVQGLGVSCLVKILMFCRYIVQQLGNWLVLVLVLAGLVLALIMSPWWLVVEVMLAGLVLVLVLALDERCGRPRIRVDAVSRPLATTMLLGVGATVGVLVHSFPLWQQVLLVVVLVVLSLLVTLERDRVKHFALVSIIAHATQLWVADWRALMHRRDRLVKWEPHEWVLDSGACIHHTSNPLVLDANEGNYLQSHDQKMGSLYAQLRLRSVRTKLFVFPGVYYVAGNDEDDGRNVVSVSQLARDHGLVTVFEPTSCQVKEKKTGEIVGEGILRNGMYMLDYLHVVGQYKGDGGASSGGKHNDRGSGSRGHEGRGNTNNNGEGRAGGPSRGFSVGGIGASRNPEQGDSGSGANGGDINDEEIEEEESMDEEEIQEMNDENIEEEDIGRIHQEINSNGEEEEDDDKKRGGRSTFEESSNKACTNLLFGLSRFVLVLCLCIIATCISWLQCTSWETGVIRKPATFNNLDLHNLLGFLFFTIISGLQLLRTLSTTMQFTSWKLVKQIGYLFRRKGTDKDDKEGTSGDYIQESSQDQNKRLFGLSRFDVNKDPTGYCRRMLPVGAFSTSINPTRREEFLVDSGASFHATWKQSILFPYPPHLQNHTRPPTRRFGGIAGSIAVTKSGYLNGNIMLDGVLLAPESRMNLVSVGQLSVQYGAQVEMDDEGVTIKKKRDGMKIGGGRMLNNHLYVLERFQPGRIFAHLHAPHPNVFGRRPPGPAQ